MWNKKSHLYIMTSTLRLVYGGRTNSLLQRARLLTENKSPIKSVTLLTCNYNPNYNDVYRDYRAEGTVNNNINFMNMYDWFKWSKKRGIKNNYLNYLKKRFGKGLHELKKENSRRITYYYKEGIPQFSLSYNKKGEEVKHIDVFLNNFDHTAKRLYINSDGNIHKIRVFKDKFEKNIVRDIFVDQEMNAYLTREYYYEGDKLKTARNILLKRNGSGKNFVTESELITYWLDKLFENGDTIVSDARILDKSLLQVNKNVKRIFQAHGPHLSVPSNLNSTMKKGFKYLLENIKGKDDVIITLTEAQKADMVKKYPQLENKIKVIPHCIEADKSKVSYNAVIPKKISVVSRLVPLKRIDHTLKVFSEFLKERPGYTLDIYGFGQEEENLKKLAKKLNIAKSVFFKGFTSVPHQVFQTSEFTIMTSKYEGLGLTILESIVNGCPVASYDINWGPNEIIRDHNGVLVKDGNIQELKEAMIRLADRPLKRKKVAKIEPKFTKKFFLKEWGKLLK